MVLPPDVAAFYRRFSEAQLYDPRHCDPRCAILPPEEFVQVGESILGEPTTVGVERSWYALAHVMDGNYIAIDLLPGRLGRCYDCFHETYGDRGYCNIIALSFTEFLNHLVAADGGHYWLESGHPNYGDAYDDESRVK